MGCMAVLDWGSGYVGPTMEPGVPSTAIYRTDRRVDTRGVLAPVTEMALVPVESASPQLAWASTLSNIGLTYYDTPLPPGDLFDYDFLANEDIREDGRHAFAAGFMMIGTAALSLSVHA
eukprot:COSAG06_NODE_21131_length_768_cov_1.294469_1_plen_118_part_10